MIKILTLCILFIPTIAFSQSSTLYPTDVEKVLQKAGHNRIELENAIKYFKKSDAPLKLKSIYFLIANMDIHYSMDYYWADSTGLKIAYNELNYKDFDTAIKAFDELKNRVGKIKPIPYKYYDIDTIKASYLIENVEQAFEVWQSPSGKNLSFDDFCEYILPYRVSVEPLQNWRTLYRKKFGWVADSLKSKSNVETATLIGNDLRSWFVNTYGKENRLEPLPRLGGVQLIIRKKGPCEDISDLATFILRSQGIPVSSDIVPMWATSTGGHFTNTIIERNNTPNFFDASVSVEKNALSREPSKVIRITYGKQPNTLAQIEKEENIPPGFLRTSNYIDITKQYWPVKDIKTVLAKVPAKSEIVYACVFNNMRWKPTWWAKNKDDSVAFQSMTRGVVYLPASYRNGKMIPVGYPFALGYNNESMLKPDIIHRREVTIAGQEKYLIFRVGQMYRLYYWDNSWKLISGQSANDASQALIYKNVPKNALLLLIPEYSAGKERPFMITDDNKRVWW